jgi:FMN phosphatase YigB (HAD superfamily)
MINTIMFDLDGTLTPTSDEDFLKAYFGLLALRFSRNGYEDKKAFLNAVWNGNRAMLRNDGTVINKERFWMEFLKEDPDGKKDEELFMNFYETDFQNTKSVLQDRRDLCGIFDSLREKGYTLILATNPVFPTPAIKTRLSWVNLATEHFDYISTYDNSSFCKPNIEYFSEILTKTGKSPADCIMIGNSPTEDMAALGAGIKSYLVTDYLENPKNVPITDYNTYTFGEISDMLKALPQL